jgi:hypothetical protein
MPGQLDDAASILLRIKGADLNAYRPEDHARESDQAHRNQDG